MQAHRHLPSTPMVIVGAALAALFLIDAANAQGRSCEQLRDEIAARIALPKDSFRLEIASKDATGAGKTMGSCEMGARKIVFMDASASDSSPTRTATPAQPAAPAAPTPASPPAAAVAPLVTEPAPANVAPATANTVPQIRPATRRGGLDEATLNQYKGWIAEARAQHPYADTEKRMLDVMLCESGGNAGIVSPNGLHHGLFQYMPATWNGSWNTYRDAQLTDARAQIFATALAWSTGKTNQWGCYRKFL